MKIQPVQNNNMNFQGLHVDKKIYRQLGAGRGEGVFLHNSAIKECADRFEVLVEKGKPIKREKMSPSIAFMNQFGTTVISMTIGMAGAVLAPIFTGSAIPATPVQVILCGTISSLIGLIGATGYIYNKNRGNDYEYNLQVGKKIKDSMFGKKELVSPLSKKYSIKKYDDINRIKDVAEVAVQRDEQHFMDIIDHYNINDLYEPKNILDILQNRAIKQNYSNGESFNYKLQDGSNDTLLTKFFDIVPTEENKKDYDKVVEIIKNTENIDYNQIDSNGISLIEKIMNSENFETLNLVKDFEFNYSREMDFAYENISNPKFKRRIKNLNVKFPNIEEAIRLQSENALIAAVPEFKSPFCNVTQILDNAFEKMALGDYYSILKILKYNEVDVSKVKYQ